MSNNYEMKIIGGSGNPELTLKIAGWLNLKPVETVVGKFNDGETRVEFKESIRGCDVFIVQPTCTPVNDNLMELFILIHNARLASAKRITAVIPYFGYARQDRKTKPRVPITASLVAQLIETSGPDRVLTLDLHCGQIQGFFRSIPVDNLYADKVTVTRLNIEYEGTKYDFAHDFVVVSPDAGGAERARRIADALGATRPVATIMKRRVEAGKIESMQLVGNVKNEVCIIVDDMIDSGRTAVKAAQLLKENGACIVILCATHGVFSDDAAKTLSSPYLDEIFVTNSIPTTKDISAVSKIKLMDVSSLFAGAMRKIHKEESLSDLF